MKCGVTIYAEGGDENCKNHKAHIRSHYRIWLKCWSALIKIFSQNCVIKWYSNGQNWLLTNFSLHWVVNLMLKIRRLLIIGWVIEMIWIISGGLFLYGNIQLIVLKWDTWFAYVFRLAIVSTVYINEWCVRVVWNWWRIRKMIVCS